MNFNLLAPIRLPIQTGHPFGEGRSWLQAVLLIEKDHLGEYSTGINKMLLFPVEYSTGNNNTLFIIHFTIHLFA